MFLNGVLGHERAEYGGLCGVGWMRWDANANVGTFWGVARKCRYGVLMRMGEGWVFLNGVLGHERAGFVVNSGETSKGSIPGEQPWVGM